ncbi:fluoride efflux transporter FluC [Deinococcus peraridilitoris]|uniref:fluoride efflux transporter FluC n=1 Tax=Deinococcus peraridilitoris TaxID=432329 RepID=UPI00030B9414|nr:CrcB family protein [Deinococcus peraridilitoris]
MLWQLAAVALGGAVGGLLRASLIQAFPGWPGTLPLVILAENVTGAFLLGLVLTLLLRRPRIPQGVRLFVCTGVLGSFTTFSNLTLDVVQLASAGQFALALAYALGSVLLGLTATLLGVTIGRRLGTGSDVSSSAPSGGLR